MRLFPVPFRITRTKRCPEGFYLIVNGTKIRFATRKLAIEAGVAILQLQRLQVVSLREYAASRKAKLSRTDVAPNSTSLPDPQSFLP